MPSMGVNQKMGAGDDQAVALTYDTPPVLATELLEICRGRVTWMNRIDRMKNRRSWSALLMSWMGKLKVELAICSLFQYI